MFLTDTWLYTQVPEVFLEVFSRLVAASWLAHSLFRLVKFQEKPLGPGKLLYGNV